MDIFGLGNSILKTVGFSLRPLRKKLSCREIDLNEKTSKKTECGCCGTKSKTYYDKKRRLVRDLACADVDIYLDIEVRRVNCKKCRKVKQEKLSSI